MQPWSPHIYHADGLRANITPEVLDAATSEIETFLSRSPRLAPVLSLGHLAALTGVSYKYLRRIVSRTMPNSYVDFSLMGRTGHIRRISTPAKDLMTAQRWIATNILADVACGPNSFAYRRGSSIIECAWRHCSSRWLIKLDVTRFFPSIIEPQIFDVFASLGYRRLVALELSRICTWPDVSDDRLEISHQVERKEGPSYSYSHLGRLPIGAPTSPMLSNAYMRPFDTEISAYCAHQGLIYSRYADDIFVSSDRRDFRRSDAARMAQYVRVALRSYGLYANDAKEVIVPPGARKIVLGMLVDGASPRLLPEFKKRLRMHYHFIERFGIEQHAFARRFPSVPMLDRHLRGLIAFAAQVEPNYAENLRTMHEKFQWARFD